MSLYDTDFYAWSNAQAALLRSGRLAAADVEHIAEEIESMGRSEKRELLSRLALLLMHLLRWQAQPMLRGNSWRATIKVQRRGANGFRSFLFCLRCLASKNRFTQALGIAQAAALGVSGSY